MRTIIILLAVIFLCSNFGWSQKTYYLKTDRETEELIVDGQKWSGKAFFEVESEKPLLQVIVKDLGYKSEFDILTEDTNHRYTADHRLNVDTNIICIIKPISLEFDKEDFDFKTHKLDYATYLKDLDHDGQLQHDYSNMKYEGDVLNKIKLDNQFIINDLNEYHNSTIGRYKFYVLAHINSIYLYEVIMKDGERFIQAYVDTEWSITGRHTENLPRFPHPGKSGKIVYSDSEKDNDEMLNLAVHDAIMDSLFYFLEQQEMKLVKALDF